MHLRFGEKFSHRSRRPCCICARRPHGGGRSFAFPSSFGPCLSSSEPPFSTSAACLSNLSHEIVQLSEKFSRVAMLDVSEEICDNTAHQTTKRFSPMTRSFASICRSAFTALSDEDYAAYHRSLKPRQYHGVVSVESVVGEGNPSLADGNVITVKQQRMLRRKNG